MTTTQNLTKPSTETTQPTPRKYDVYDFQKELLSLLDYLRATPSIRSKAQLFKELDFTVSRYYRLTKKYSENKRVVDLNMKISEIIEARLIEHGLDAKNPAFVIFLLKNFYNYQDKREVETETTHVFKVTRGTAELIKPRPKRIKLVSK